MRELGRVREVYRDRVVIDIVEHSASSCNQCSLHGHCHIENGERRLTLWTKGNWRVGDEVLGGDERDGSDRDCHPSFSHSDDSG